MIPSAGGDPLAHVSWGADGPRVGLIGSPTDLLRRGRRGVGLVVSAACFIMAGVVVFASFFAGHDRPSDLTVQRVAGEAQSPAATIANPAPPVQEPGSNMDAATPPPAVPVRLWHCNASVCGIADEAWTDENGDRRARFGTQVVGVTRACQTGAQCQMPMPGISHRWCVIAGQIAKRGNTSSCGT